MILGTGEYRYRLEQEWAKIPENFILDDAVDIATDSHDRVFVFCRGNHPILIFDREGHFVSCWGEGQFRQPHGIFIGPDDSVYLVDAQCHTVEKFTLSGKLILRLGVRDWAEMTVRGKPFNMPTGLALSSSGEMFVSDGYGNQRVHKFSPDGKLLKSWGEYGRGPGQFRLVHNIAVDKDGKVYVCDRENDRIQTFSSDGEFLNEWTDLHKPGDVYIDQKRDIIYVAEQGRPGPQKPRISIRDLDGNILCIWEGRESDGGGVLENPHGIWVDSCGDIYVGEIVKAKRILKFVRLK
jgi:DNA-binding beta-propeller fold protein YncE